MNNQHAKNGIITLTTDFGIKDHYVASMKGVILTINPKARIIDVTHDIDSYDIMSCAFIVSNFYKYYPEGTINVVVVDPGVGTSRRSISIYADGYYFVGPDNGIFSFIIENCKYVEIFSLLNKKYFLKDISSTFHGRDIFAPVASYLSINIEPKSFGRRLNKVKILNSTKAIIEHNTVKGKFIYEDKFGNLITNIDSKTAKRIYEINIQGKKLTKIANSYGNKKKGEIVALIGSTGFLEIAVNKGRASEIIDKESYVICSIK